jgi:hypothetical protein
MQLHQRYKLFPANRNILLLTFSSSIQLKQEEFKDTKGVIRMHKSKDGQKKKDKETNNDL